MNKLSLANNEEVIALVKGVMTEEFLSMEATPSFLDELAVQLYRQHFDMAFCTRAVEDMHSWQDGQRVVRCIFNTYKSHCQMCEAQRTKPDREPDMAALAAIPDRRFRDNPLRLKMDCRTLASAVLEAWNRIEALDDKVAGLEDRARLMRQSMEGVEVSLTRARHRVDESLAAYVELKDSAVDADAILEDMFTAMTEGAQAYVDMHPDRAPNVKEFLRMVIPDRYQSLVERITFTALYSEINERTIPAERLAGARKLLWPLCEDREVVEWWMSRFAQQRSTPKMGRELLPEFKADQRLDFSKATQGDVAEGISLCLTYESGSSPSNVGKWL